MGLTNRCSAVASAWARLSVVLGVVMGVGGVDRGFSEEVREAGRGAAARREGARASVPRASRPELVPRQILNVSSGGVGSGSGGGCGSSALGGVVALFLTHELSTLPQCHCPS